MMHTNITPDNTIFLLLSFEGPDSYSLAGGLGVRVTNLSSTLAQMGFPTHLLFVGDPGRKGEEISQWGKLVLHRWCQWISAYHPDGVYQGEYEKLYDFNESVPGFVSEHIVNPALKQGKLVVILGEEWHTAEVMCRISDVLNKNNTRDRVTMFWNANNTFGFDQINWGRLAYTATITTVSRYMKQIMRGLDVNPLVIPNGIPKELLRPVNARATDRLKRILRADLLLAKVARWDPDKNWDTAVEATAGLKARGVRTVLLARGGIEPYGGEIMRNARSLGLTVEEVENKHNSLEDYFRAIEEHSRADILNIRFHCPQEFLRVIYRASDAVLANSSHEPFGLVALEAMAAGGIAFVGGSGEDYAFIFNNSIVLETSDPEEVEDRVMHLIANPAEAKRIRTAARETARLFTWEEVIKILIQKLEYQARVQEALALPARPATPDKSPGDDADGGRLINPVTREKVGN